MAQRAWERTFANMLKVHFERERTVVLAKLDSRKTKERYTKALEAKYSPDQPRDDHGRFGESNGGFPKGYPPNAPNLIHRVMSDAEWNASVKKGYFEPSATGLPSGGNGWMSFDSLYASDHPDPGYAPDSGTGRIVTFDRNKDGWRLGDGYAEHEVGDLRPGHSVTFLNEGRVPTSSVVHVTDSMTKPQMRTMVNDRTARMRDGDGSFHAESWQTAKLKLLSDEELAQRQAGRDWVTAHIHEDNPADHSVASYVTGSGGINRSLRTGDAPAAFMTEIAPILAGVDKAIASSTVDVDTVAYRGQASDFLANAKVGDTFVDHGYVSTSLLSHWAASFGTNRTTGSVIEMHIPAGSHAFAPADRVEHELILPRDSTYRVDAVGDHPVLTFLGKR